ncbi:MAG: hypothetical protein ACRDN8_22435, partial [Thermoleophilaceae bacterium]
MRRLVGGTAHRLRSRREGVGAGLTIVLASIAAFAAGATALALLRSGDWESTAVVSGAPTSEPARSLGVARRALAAAGAGREGAGALLDHLEVERRTGGDIAFTVSAD